MNVPQSHPATNRSCMCALARGGMALTGCSGLPVRNASTSSAFQPKTRSAGVSAGSPQPASIEGPPGSPGSISASARRTELGIGGGRSATIRINPRASTMDARALARIVPGLASSPPQLPEWCAPSRREGAHHSGNWGGLLANPGTILASALASMVEARGFIRMVALRPPPIPNSVRRALADIEPGEPGGPSIDAGWGEPALTPAERVFGWDALGVVAG